MISEDRICASSDEVALETREDEGTVCFSFVESTDIGSILARVAAWFDFGLARASALLPVACALDGNVIGEFVGPGKNCLRLVEGICVSERRALRLASRRAVSSESARALASAASSIACKASLCIRMVSSSSAI